MGKLRTPNRISILLALIALLLVPILPAYADFVYAISQTSVSALLSATAPTGMGQSFTTMAKGHITKVAVNLGEGNTWTSITVRIVAGNTGSSTAPAVCQETLIPLSRRGWASFTLNNPCSVSDHTQYTFQLLPNAGKLVVGAGSSIPPYADGQMWVVNAQGGFGFGRGTPGPQDLAFRVTILANPTAVELASFTTSAAGGAIRLQWETATELDNLGFNLYRAQAVNGPRTRLNATLIPSHNPGSSVGGSYEFVDGTISPRVTYYYWLEDLDVHGQATLHGPVTAMLTPGGQLLRGQPQPGFKPPSIRNP